VVATTDVTDAAMREALASAEAALDEGDYARSVQHTVAAYERLIEMRPDMIVAPRFAHRFAAPQGGGPPPAGIGGQSMAAPRPWPSDHGVSFSVDDDGKPSLTFAKERFTLSEAATYFEYTLDMVLRAQRRPPQTP
jgi:hypothetical protein